MNLGKVGRQNAQTSDDGWSVEILVTVFREGFTADREAALHRTSCE